MLRRLSHAYLGLNGCNDTVNKEVHLGGRGGSLREKDQLLKEKRKAASYLLAHLKERL
jgi:hypothetical protein